MASRRILELVLALFLVTVVFSRAKAQSNCNNMIASLSPCFDYIKGNSSSPSPECCNQLANVIKEQGQCLCEVINGSASSIGVSINRTRAFELPGACNLQTPSITQCNVTGTSPSGAPKGSSGSPRTPPGVDASGGCRIKMPFLDDQLVSVLVIVASFVSIFTAIF